MTKSDIQKFIDYMEDYEKDPWTEEAVENTFGDKSLEEAIHTRMVELSLFNNGIATYLLNR